MAKGGKSSGFVSKGERPVVSRKLRNEMRREARANPPIKTILARMKYRDELAKRQDGASKALFSKLLEKESVFHQAEALFEQYASKGATYAACVQAVKTNYVPTFKNKYSN